MLSLFRVDTSTVDWVFLFGWAGLGSYLLSTILFFHLASILKTKQRCPRSRGVQGSKQQRFFLPASVTVSAQHWRPCQKAKKLEGKNAQLEEKNAQLDDDMLQLDSWAMKDEGEIAGLKKEIAGLKKELEQERVQRAEEKSRSDKWCEHCEAEKARMRLEAGGGAG